MGPFLLKNLECDCEQAAAGHMDARKPIEKLTSSEGTADALEQAH